MTFRIAIGRCDCRPPYRNEAEESVCKTIRERLSRWRNRLPADLAAVPVQRFEEQIVEGRRVTFGTYKLQCGSGETLVVCQALLHTLWRPTYLSIGSVGRLYAEGLLIRDTNLETAPDEFMWQFR